MVVSPGPLRTQLRMSQTRPGQIVYISKGELLAWGGTAILERLPSGTVMKTPIPNPNCRAEERDHRRNMRLEAKIYAVIGNSPLVPRLINWDDETCCLEIEYLENGNLREYVRENNQTITIQLQIQWSLQAAEAIGVLHSHAAIHCDLSPRNFLLDSELNVRIADFGGASLCGSEPSATPATRFLPPGYDSNATPVFQVDLFSLGSLIHFIMAGSYPYEDLPCDKVESLFEVDEFPDVSSITAGDIIMQCWKREATSAKSICDSLMAISCLSNRAARFDLARTGKESEIGTIQT
ncbi:kinase-like domain-containing protein [Aspergillus carlsbadensis]|nr:kinase-like domain-containing protein [Aspergillus carlsbadensis]